MCVVASRLARRLSFIELGRAEGSDHAALKTTRSVELPFSPRNLALVRGGSKLVVADAFGGRLAVVDRTNATLESVRSLPGHNIRGLAPSPDGRALVVAHQVLHRLARTTFEDVHWGSLLSNHLRVLRLDAVLAPGSDAALLRGSRLLDLGDVGNAAGDPGGLAFDRGGNLVVALAGVGEIAVGPVPTGPLRRVSVGRRPTAVAVAPGPGATTVYVADTHADTISVVAVDSGRRVRTIALGPLPEPDAIERGERLFYDARLSHDGWMSCHSCHTDGHTNGLVSDTLGDGSFGAPKRVPSLLGVGATGPWTWIGSIDRLEAQVRKSIETTMRGSPPSDESVAALTAYLRALAPPDPAMVQRTPDDAAAATRGRETFRTRGCAECHAPPEYTTPGRFDVGLEDEVGNRRFNPPSLRGVVLRAPWLHDGRAGTLGEVFRRHGHPPGTVLTPQEVADLVAFLKTI
jgi:cytochrome c peroxidase